MDLNNKGIFVSDLKMRGLKGSVLTVFASQENNQSNITCVVVLKKKSVMSYISETVQLIVNGYKGRWYIICKEL